ncbi:MAG TPA: hypothetical protein ENL03_02715 [Phycisphaerae bacterium]|nr:hypothetical protein [Phycisphaerae bacterium]
MTRKTVVSIVAILLLGSAALADVKTVRFKRGSKVVEITGEVMKTDTGIDVKGRLVTISIPTADIVSIEDPVTPAGQYKNKIDKVDATDPDALVELGKWAMDQKMLTEAKANFLAALKINPDHVRGTLFLRIVEVRIKEETNPRGGKPKFNKEWILEMEDVYKIRREELRDSDRNVSIDLKDKLIDRYVLANPGTDGFEKTGFERYFRASSRMYQARHILKHEPADSHFRDDIIIKSDPDFMKEFVRDIWPTVSSSCASVKCHGGKKAKGGLKLFRIAGNTVNVRYTNFILLDGIRTHKKKALINRGIPDESVLLQYLLPKDIQAVKHPFPIKAAFTSKKDRKYMMMHNWIKGLKYFPKHPDYNLIYKPPFNMKLVFGVQGPIFDKPKDDPKPKDTPKNP